MPPVTFRLTYKALKLKLKLSTLNVLHQIYNQAIFQKKGQLKKQKIISGSKLNLKIWG